MGITIGTNLSDQSLGNQAKTIASTALQAANDAQVDVDGLAVADVAGLQAELDLKPHVFPHLFATSADMGTTTVNSNIVAAISSGAISEGAIVETTSYYPLSEYASGNLRSGGNRYELIASTTSADKGNRIQVTGTHQLVGQFPNGVYTNAQFGANGVDQDVDRVAFNSALAASSGKTLKIPPGTWYYRDALITGSIYKIANSQSGVGFDNTRVICEGWLKLQDWDGIQNIETGLSLVGVRGGEWDWKFDGNRTNMKDHEFTHCLILGGCVGWTINNMDVKEIRGDGLVLHELAWNTVSQQTADFHIKRFSGRNTADDGRNGISLISCIDGQIDYFYSEKIGGFLEGGTKAMPGGLDYEPSYTIQSVKRVNTTYCRVITKGWTGCAMVGVEGTHNIIDCHIAYAHITCRGAGSDSMAAMRYCKSSSMKVKIDLDAATYPEPLNTGYQSVTAGRFADCEDSNYHVIARGVHRGTKVGTWPGNTNESASKNCVITLDFDYYCHFVAQLSHLDSCVVNLIIGKARTAVQRSGATPLLYAVEFKDQEGRGLTGSKVSIKDTVINVQFPYDAELVRAFSMIDGANSVTLNSVAINGDMRGWDVAPLNKFNALSTGVVKTAKGLGTSALLPTGSKTSIGDVVKRDAIPTGEIVTGGYVDEWIRLTASGAGDVLGTDWRARTKA